MLNIYSGIMVAISNSDFFIDECSGYICSNDPMNGRNPQLRSTKIFVSVMLSFQVVNERDFF